MTDLVNRIDPVFFFLSIGLFFVGYFSAGSIVKSNIRLLLCLPLWLWQKLKKIIAKRPAGLSIFLLIFTFNSISLLLNIVSGFAVLLPFVFSVWVGMNVGIMAYQEGGFKIQLALLFFPHAILELPAAWLSFTSGMQISWHIFSERSLNADLILPYFEIYLKIILPLLFVAAIIESALIHFSLKRL